MKCNGCNGEDIDQNIQENIQKYGVSIIGTEHITPEGNYISMTYSIGVTETTGYPELVIFGIPVEHAKIFINMYFKMHEDGKIIKPGVDYNEFAEGFPTRFKEITESSYRDHLYKAAAFNDQNNNPLKAMQLIFPDSHGRWFWEEGVDPEFKTLLNILD